MENPEIGSHSISRVVFSSFYPEIHTQELVEENSVVLEIELAVTKAIKLSKEGRANIPQELVLQIQYLEVHLNEIETLSLEYINAIEDKGNKATSETSQSSSEGGVESLNFSFSSDDQEAEEKILKLRFNLTEKISILITSDQTNLLKLSKDHFSGWWLLKNCQDKLRLINSSFLKEQLINRCINYFLFYKKSKEIISEIIPFIFKEFAPSCVYTSDVTFEIEVLGQETHKRGKNVLKVIFSLENKNLFSISYKPREALNDKRVMKLFDDLNQLDVSEKSIDAHLGVRKIVNHCWNGEEFSLWEFAEGVTYESVASATIEYKFPHTTLQGKRLYSQLCRLESICSCIRLSDLHGGNIVFSKVERLEDDIQIFAIDLENFQFIPGGRTGLFEQYPVLPKPKEGRELRLLDQFNDETRSIPFRFIPLDTGVFLGSLSFCSSFKGTREDLMKMLNQLEFKMIIGPDSLEWYILNDFIHNDVPFLTQNQDKLYYWTPDGLINIASKEKTKEGTL